MDGQSREELEDLQTADAPEDVAVLYSWANLKGIKYRDFSASRREYRAQLRHRAAEAQREVELKAKAEAEAAAAITERAAREAEEAARFHEAESRRASQERRVQESAVQGVARDHAMRHAAELNRQAAAERVEAARRAEAVAAAEAAARREARELAEAQASAQRQAARYAESEHLRRSLAAGQSESFLPGPLFDPYEEGQPVDIPGRSFPRPAAPREELGPTRMPRSRDPLSILPDSPRSSAGQETWAEESHQRLYRGPGAASEVDPVLDSDIVARAPARYSYEPNSQERVAAVDQYAQYAPYADSAQRDDAPTAASRSRYEEAAAEAARRSAEVTRRPRGFQPDEASGLYRVPGGEERGTATPAWLHGQTEERDAAESRLRIPASGLPPDTLQESRERVASRWYALKGRFYGETPPAEAQEEPSSDGAAPLVEVFSLAGGVGKTSMVATLGRALSASGESVLLADTTSQGLLPFYFGASELKPGVVRRFSPPPGSLDAPIALVSYETAGKEADAPDEWLAEELMAASRGMQRVLLDMSPASGWVLRRLARLNSQVIVPVSPDMNSVISLGPVEKFFAGMFDGGGRPLLPYYLLNGFDATLPLHLDVREVMRQQLGDRLLPFVIRRSPSISEALAEGMTVIDYAPDSAAAADYMNLAAWLRMESAAAVSGSKNSRWSER